MGDREGLRLEPGRLAARFFMDHAPDLSEEQLS